MKLTKENLIELTDLAVKTATAAGKMISSHADKRFKVMHKEQQTSEASQVLTEVDLMSQQLIVTALQPSCDEFDLGLLAEESEDNQSRFEKDYFWCVDPLDGTLAFVEKHPGYSVSIALVAKDGSPIIGVVYDPTTGNCYQATKGLGVFRNGQPFTVGSLEKNDKKLTLIADRSYTKTEQYQQLIEELEQKYILKKITEGGAVMNAIWALENAPAIYQKHPKPKGGSIWDYAATAAIFEELGLKVSDIFGNKLELNRKDSTYMNHHGILFDCSLLSR